MKKTINMLSRAGTIKGQGVSSAHDEMVGLVKTELADYFEVVNGYFKNGDITHYHTVNLEYFFKIPFAKFRGVTVGYVHFLPETIEGSIKLAKVCKHVFYRYLIRFYKSMDYLVVVNPYFIDLLKKYGIERDKVVYIPNYVDDSMFFPVSAEEKLSLRDQYGISRDKFTIMCAGQLQTRKGIFDFVETAKQMPDKQFIWAGGFSFGKITDGYSEIKAIVDNPPENVKFLGILDREKMNGIYNMADVMFLASFEELFPMTILEAMNCGVPLLLRDLDIYENILFDFYQKGSSVGDFVAIINRLAEDKDYYQMAVEQSYKGHIFYSKEHVSDMWKNFYLRIASEMEKVHNYA